MGLHEAFIREMAENIISKLEGSDESQLRFCSPDPPSRTIILGSLAGIKKEKKDSKSIIENNSLSIKMRSRSDLNISAKVSYSLFKKTDLNAEEVEQYGENALDYNAWERMDFVYDVMLGPNNNSIELPFIYEDERVENYKLVIQYNSVDENNNKQITIMISNQTETDNGYIFNVKADLSVRKESLIPYSYKYVCEGEHKAVTPEPLFRTINCCAEYCDEEKLIRIDNHAGFELIKTAPKVDEDNIELSFKTLGSDEFASRLKEYLSILRTYQKEYELYYSNTDKEKQLGREYQNLCDRFEYGIIAIEENNNAQKAFMFMNRAFELTSNFNCWRAFQIAYIVSTIPAIIDPQADRDYCDVIHVSTGGGKTETYLGLVLFTIFYERLMGKTCGVTSIIKFPLRMLSIQQLQRVSKVVMIAEEIRKQNNIPGDSFSMAFFIGDSEEFPNKFKDAADMVRAGKNEGKLLHYCPVCRSKISLVVLDNESIAHVCTNEACKRTYHLFYTDEELYRFLPTVVISTVDKFSTVSMNRRIKNIFGGKTNQCERGHGHFPKGEECELCKSVGKISPLSVRSTPSLIIQDELHLIRESFGTIDSHFESFCDELQHELTGKYPKHIALTATITGCSDQIEQLYNKFTRIFPGKNPSGNEENPFFYDVRSNEDYQLHRKIMGLRPNGRDNQYASLLTLKYISEFVCGVDNDPAWWAKRLGCDEKEIIDLISYYNRVLTYHGKVSDSYSMNHFLDTVVNSNKHDYLYEGHPLTGEKSTQEITDVIESVESFKKHDDVGMHATFATSVVSHGVDIDKWNIMVFQGMPDNTAEYIQATSRVGRKYPGLVFIWFYPNRIRDISFFNHFIEYHRMLDDKVEPVSINKWTHLSFYETCTSIFNASILNYMSAKLEKKIISKTEIEDVFKDSANERMLIDFMNKVYHVSAEVEGSDFFKEMIPIIIQERLNKIRGAIGSKSELAFFPKIISSKNSDKYFSTQSGMRGIQDNVVFSMSPSSRIYLGKED